MPVYSFGLCDAVTRDPAVEAELGDREIEHLGPDQTDVGDICAAVSRSVDHRRRHARRRDAHVAPDGDGARLELLDIRTSDPVRSVFVDL